MSKTLEECIKERDKFLKEHPEMQEYQDKIDKALEGIEDPKERMETLSAMIHDKLKELANNMRRLIDCVNTYKNTLILEEMECSEENKQ